MKQKIKWISLLIIVCCMVVLFIETRNITTENVEPPVSHILAEIIEEPQPETDLVVKPDPPEYLPTIIEEISDEVEFEEPDSTIPLVTASVMDEITDEPVVGIKVHIQNQGNKDFWKLESTNSEGLAFFENVPEGNYQIDIGIPNKAFFQSEYVKLNNEIDNVYLILSNYISNDLLVLDESGNPIPNFNIHSFTQWQDGSTPRKLITTDSKGFARVTNLFTEHYTNLEPDLGWYISEDPKWINATYFKAVPKRMNEPITLYAKPYDHITFCFILRDIPANFDSSTFDLSFKGIDGNNHLIKKIKQLKCTTIENEGHDKYRYSIASTNSRGESTLSMGDAIIHSKFIAGGSFSVDPNAEQKDIEINFGGDRNIEVKFVTDDQKPIPHMKQSIRLYVDIDNVDHRFRYELYQPNENGITNVKIPTSCSISFSTNPESEYYFHGKTSFDSKDIQGDTLNIQMNKAPTLNGKITGPNHTLLTNTTVREIKFSDRGRISHIGDEFKTNAQGEYSLVRSRGSGDNGLLVILSEDKQYGKVIKAHEVDTQELNLVLEEKTILTRTLEKPMRVLPYLRNKEKRINIDQREKVFGIEISYSKISGVSSIQYFSPDFFEFTETDKPKSQW